MFYWYVAFVQLFVSLPMLAVHSKLNVTLKSYGALRTTLIELTCDHVINHLPILVL